MFIFVFIFAKWFNQLVKPFGEYHDNRRDYFIIGT